MGEGSASGAGEQGRILCGIMNRNKMKSFFLRKKNQIRPKRMYIREFWSDKLQSGYVQLLISKPGSVSATGAIKIYLSHNYIGKSPLLPWLLVTFYILDFARF